jgi:tetratricopeptide (TPR) repeat protein
VLALAMVANLIAGTVVSMWGIRQWTTPEILFATQAKIDPHFLAGVRNYSQSLELNGHADEEVRITNNTLTWMFGTDKWIDLLRTKKLAVFTPEFIERLKTNGGDPDRKALAAFIGANASGLARLNRNAEAIVVEQQALMLGPKDARIHYAYGQLLLKSDRPEALRQYEIALKLTPNFSACAAALAHERIIDGRYAEAKALLEPVVEELGWNSSTWIDLAKAKIGLGDLAGASAALDGAMHAIYVKKEEIEPLRKQIKGLQAAKGAARR